MKPVQKIVKSFPANSQKLHSSSDHSKIKHVRCSNTTPSKIGKFIIPNGKERMCCLAPIPAENRLQLPTPNRPLRSTSSFPSSFQLRRCVTWRCVLCDIMSEELCHASSRSHAMRQMACIGVNIRTRNKKLGESCSLNSIVFWTIWSESLFPTTIQTAGSCRLSFRFALACLVNAKFSVMDTHLTRTP